MVNHFVYDLFEQQFPINYSTETDHLLSECMVEMKNKFPTIEITGHNSSFSQKETNIPYPHQRYVINTKDAINLPNIIIIPLDHKTNESKMMYILLSSSIQLGNEIINDWKELMTKAISTITNEHSFFPWSAIIQQNHVGIETIAHALRHDVTIGNIKIKNGNQRGYTYHKFGNSWGTKIYGNEHKLSFPIWPIIIEGQTKACNSTSVTEPAMQIVHKVMALITLAWESDWILGQAPLYAPNGALKIPKLDAGLVSYSSKKYKTFPKWAIDKFEIIDSHKPIKNALTAFHEASKLSYNNHPSYALIAYVAIIESLGKILLNKNCLQEHSNAACFRAAVTNVRSQQDEIKELIGIYKLRHATAHEGELHADEINQGSFIIPKSFNSLGGFKFIYNDLLKIKSVARDNLIKAIKSL